MRKILLLVTAVLLLFGFMSCDFLLQGVNGKDDKIQTNATNSKALFYRGHELTSDEEKVYDQLCKIEQKYKAPVIRVGLESRIDEVRKKLAIEAAKYFYGEEGTLDELFADGERFYYKAENLSNVGMSFAYILESQQTVDLADKFADSDGPVVCIKSEGQSYGMFIAAMLGLRREFDALWNFAHIYMQNRSEQNDGKYYFQWNVAYHINSGKVEPITSTGGNNSAPDGEEYFAMALILAHLRWGSEKGWKRETNDYTFDYIERANDIIVAMIKNTNRMFFFPSDTFWDTTKGKFYTDDEGNELTADYFLPKYLVDSSTTDLSYILPHFYDKFAKYGNLTDGDRIVYKSAAEDGRAFLRQYLDNSINAINKFDSENKWETNGNEPGMPVKQYYMHLKKTCPGSDRWNNSSTFEMDSWRVLSNIAIDSQLNGSDIYNEGSGRYDWVNNWAYRMVSFLESNSGIGKHGYPVYYLEDQSPAIGTYTEGGYHYEDIHDLGCVSTAATLATKINALSPKHTELRNGFIKEAYDADIPVDDGPGNKYKYRYYKGNLHLINMIYLCGYYDLDPQMNNSANAPLNPYLYGTVNFSSRYSGRYLTATNVNSGDPTKAQPANSSWSSQDWKFEKARDGSPYIMIRNVWTGKYLHATQDQENAQVVCYDLNETWRSMQWEAEFADGGIRLRNIWTGKYLTVVNSNDDYADIIIKDLNTGWTSQIWDIVE